MATNAPYIAGMVFMWFTFLGLCFYLSRFADNNDELMALLFTAILGSLGFWLFIGGLIVNG